MVVFEVQDVLAVVRLLLVDVLDALVEVDGLALDLALRVAALASSVTLLHSSSHSISFSMLKVYCSPISATC